MTSDHKELEQHLRSECEQGYTIGPSALGPYSVTGETFTELCGVGPRDDETHEIVYLPTVEAAYDAAIAAFKAYASDKSGTLYWRVSPELGENKGKFAFYMRLLISDMPVIKKAAMEGSLG